MELVMIQEMAWYTSNTWADRAILQGTGIARILSDPKHGNMAVALLARNQDNLNSVLENLSTTAPGSVVEAFPTDTDPANLEKTFQVIRSHPLFKGLKLKVAIYSIKHSSKKPFMDETHSGFTKSLNDYVGGAFTFAQEALKMFFEHHGDAPLSETGEKKGTLIFTGTLWTIEMQCGICSLWVWEGKCSTAGAGFGEGDEPEGDSCCSFYCEWGY